MLQPMRSLCVLVCVSSLFLLSEAQFFDIGAASLGKAPVGFISRVGAYGDQESYASLGNAPVGVYQRQQYLPQPWYHAPRILPIHVYPPAKPPVRPPYKPVVRPPPKPVVRPPYKPVVRPPFKPLCELPGPCVAKPVRPVRPVVRPPVKPGVRPPKRPGRPPIPRATRLPQTHKPSPKPGGVRGRLLGGLLGSGGSLLGGLPVLG